MEKGPVGALTLITNLKNQGILPLSCADPKDYWRIQNQDRLGFPDVDTLAPGAATTVTVTHADGTSESCNALHTLTADQIA